MGRARCSRAQFDLHDRLHERRFLEFPGCRFGIDPVPGYLLATPNVGGVISLAVLHRNGMRWNGRC